MLAGLINAGRVDKCWQSMLYCKCFRLVDASPPVYTDIALGQACLAFHIAHIAAAQEQQTAMHAEPSPLPLTTFDIQLPVAAPSASRPLGLTTYSVLSGFGGSYGGIVSSGVPADLRFARADSSKISGWPAAAAAAAAPAANTGRAAASAARAATALVSSGGSLPAASGAAAFPRISRIPSAGSSTRPRCATGALLIVAPCLVSVLATSHPVRCVRLLHS